MLAFGRYILSAGIATLADFALVQTLLSLSLFREGLMFGTAVAAGALIGMSVNFLLSRRFAFRPDDRHAFHQARSFFVISLSTLVMRLLAAYALLALFTLPVLGLIAALPLDAPEERLAHIGAAGLVTVYSFFAHKHISFAGGVRSFVMKRPAAG